MLIDDASDDETLEKSREFLVNSKFPQERVSYVRNLESRSLTYNVVHAAFSYCKTGEIQVVLEGSERLIGNYVFDFFNAVYQRNQETWAAYSNHISTNFSYGESKPINDELNTQSKGRPKSRKIFMGALRSWYVDLLTSIPLSYHKFSNGTWFTAEFDDALLMSFYEKAGNDRIVYLPELSCLKPEPNENNNWI